MTAAEHLALAAELRTATLEVRGATERAKMRGLTAVVERGRRHG